MKHGLSGGEAFIVGVAILMAYGDLVITYFFEPKKRIPK